jgi:hypothetical protein
MDTFISHASKDAPMAVKIEAALETDGLQVWLDHSEIRLGTLLRNELQTAIQNSHSLILLWSKAAAKSRWVAAEVLTAFHLDRFIVACVSDDAPLPYFLQNTIYLHLQGGKADWVDPLRRAIRPKIDCSTGPSDFSSRRSSSTRRNTRH